MKEDHSTIKTIRAADYNFLSVVGLVMPLVTVLSIILLVISAVDTFYDVMNRKVQEASGNTNTPPVDHTTVCVCDSGYTSSVTNDFVPFVYLGFIVCMLLTSTQRLLHYRMCLKGEDKESKKKHREMEWTVLWFIMCDLTEITWVIIPLFVMSARVQWRDLLDIKWHRLAICFIFIVLRTVDAIVSLRSAVIHRFTSVVLYVPEECNVT